MEEEAGTSPVASLPNPNAFTYIVQVPKDQIYRVPPKENTLLDEKHRAHHANSPKKKRSFCFVFLFRLFCIIVSISLPLLLATLIFVIVVRPTAPIFNIDNIVTFHSGAQCDIFMKVTNPSLGMGYLIEKSDMRGAKLSYKGRSLAYGESPMLDLKAKESRMFKLWFYDAKKLVVDGAMQLRLIVAVPMRVEIRGLRMWWMNMKVDCDVRVKRLGKVTKVLSQECKVLIKFW